MTVYANRDPETGFFRLYGDDELECVKANAFLSAAEARGLSAQTIRAYAFDLVVLFRWMEVYGTRLHELDDLDLIEFIKAQRSDEAEPASINRRLTTCSLFHRFAMGTELSADRIASSPHYKGRGRERDLGLHLMRRQRRVKLKVKTAKKVVEPLTPEQVIMFLRSLTSYRDLCLVSLMLFCGLRSKEILSAKLSDVNVLEGRMLVRGKGNVERTLPLPGQLLRVLADYNQLERPSIPTVDHLFVVLKGKARGQPMTRSGIRSLFRYRRSRDPDLANANPHRFRHTFGADMARSGVPLPVLQRLMGHADVATTLRYVNLSMSDVAEEYLKAAEAVRQRYEEG